MQVFLDSPLEESLAAFTTIDTVMVTTTVVTTYRACPKRSKPVQVDTVGPGWGRRRDEFVRGDYDRATVCFQIAFANHVFW